MTDSLDLTFAVTGDMIDREYPYGLYRALAASLPWLDDEPSAGIHPMRGLTPCLGGRMMIGGRTRIVLRVPTQRTADCVRLQGAHLELPAPLQIGTFTQRPLLPYPVLHSRLVITGADDEAAFVSDVMVGLEAHELDCDIIVGKRGEIRVNGQTVTGFSLMLHGLSPQASLRAQERGIGKHRKLGCGLFVPHKSVAAVGS